MLNTTTTVMTINQLLTKYSKTKYISKFNNRRLIYLSDLYPFHNKGMLEQVISDIVNENLEDKKVIYKILIREIIVSKIKNTISLVLMIITVVWILKYSI